MFASILLAATGLGACGEGTCRPTFANPIDLQYRVRPEKTGFDFREGADPDVVMWNDRYWLFASKCGGYYVSDDLASWTLVKTRDLPLEEYAPSAWVMEGSLYFSSRDGSVHRAVDAAAGKWERVDGRIPFTIDSKLFFDGGRLFNYYGGSTNKTPLKVCELDPQTFRRMGDVLSAVEMDDMRFGWDVSGNANELTAKPGYKEGAYIVKRDGVYYFQHATPGTQYSSYCDVALTGPSPLGPFRRQSLNPFSYKPSGYAKGAGHGCTFRDRHGNWWHVTTCVIRSVNRRIVMLPVFFDTDGEMWCDTAFADWPLVIPGRRTSDPNDYHSGWMPLTYAKRAAVSSSAPGSDAKSIVDEDMRTTWSASTGNAGEWAEVDLGAPADVNAVQIGFADAGDMDSWRAESSARRWRLEVSEDGKTWKCVVDESTAANAPDHPYRAFENPVKATKIRVVCVGQPAGTLFALREIRAFGRMDVPTPAPVDSFAALRDAADRRRAVLSWSASKGADGYVVRYGPAPDKLHLSILVRDVCKAEVRSLDAKQDYWWKVDAFNASGFASGVAVAEKCGSAEDDGGKMTLVSGNGCDRCVVVSAKASRCARTAADEFVEWSSKMAGARLPIVTDEGPLPPHAVIIGRTRHTDALLDERAGEKFSESEFRLKASGGHWLIVAGDDRALLYGVYETLERFGGAEFFTPDVQVLPQGDIVVPARFDMKFSPSVAVRDPGHGFFKDAAVASRFRVNGTHVARANNEFYRFGRCPIGWHPKFSHCHSFDAIAAKEEFGATHPEYFRQGTNGVVSLPREKDPQLCLTNPDVLELAKARIAQAMREYPDTSYFGVSQMDNTRWCRCARCEAINRREGSDSGTLVAFLAPLADYMATVRPDATLTTLAYHNTRNPPATLRLPKNTLVGLCVTECDFSRPLVGHPNEGNRRFVQALRKWSEISGSVYIWDYCTDYDWFAYAMPDVHALAGNIRLYADSGVSYVYESADGCPYSFFWELKGYVIAKLLWDARQPLEPLLDRFMKAVYGPAARHARAALDLFENYPREIVNVRMGYSESVASTNFPDALFDMAAAEWKAAERAVGGRQPFAEYVRKGRVGNDSVRLVRYVYHLACGETPLVDTPEYRAEMKAAAAEFMAIEDARVAEAKTRKGGKPAWGWGWSLDSRINLYPLIKAFHDGRKIPKRVRGKWVPGSRRI